MNEQQGKIVDEWFLRNQHNGWATISLDELRTICDEVLEAEEVIDEQRASLLPQLGEAATKLKIFGEQKNIPEEFVKIINKHFWELL